MCEQSETGTKPLSCFTSLLSMFCTQHRTLFIELAIYGGVMTYLVVGQLQKSHLWIFLFLSNFNSNNSHYHNILYYLFLKGKGEKI